VPAPDRLDQYYVMRKWLNAYIAPSDQQWFQGRPPAATPEEFKAYGAGIQASMQNSLRHWHLRCSPWTSRARI